MALVTTIHGEIDESLLTKKEGLVETDDEHTTWVEYWRAEELVHRSVHVTLKKWPDGMGGTVNSF